MIQEPSSRTVPQSSSLKSQPRQERDGAKPRRPDPHATQPQQQQPRQRSQQQQQQQRQPRPVPELSPQELARLTPEQRREREVWCCDNKKLKSRRSCCFRFVTV